jgi:hypothetical protein
MSSVAFTPQAKDDELEKLREAWRCLNDLLKSLTNAEASLQNHDLSLTANHFAGCEVECWRSEESDCSGGPI